MSITYYVLSYFGIGLVIILGLMLEHRLTRPNPLVTKQDLWMVFLGGCIWPVVGIAMLFELVPQAIVDWMNER